MEAFVVIALIGSGLLLAELLLPTGGVLAVLGVIGLTVAGIVAFGSDSDVADYAGGALIALGILSGVTFYFVTRKVWRPTETSRFAPAPSNWSGPTLRRGARSTRPGASGSRGRSGAPAWPRARPRSGRGIESRSTRWTG